MIGDVLRGFAVGRFHDVSDSIGSTTAYYSAHLQCPLTAFYDSSPMPP